MLTEQLNDTTIVDLDKLPERDVILSCLMVFRQGARDFGWRQMVHERETRAILEPLHHKACDIFPALNISQQTLLYNAILANFFTVFRPPHPEAGADPPLPAVLYLGLLSPVQ